MAVFSDLKARSVLVTGGANGIGAAIVRAFWEQEAHVFFCDIDAPAGRRLARKLGTGVCFDKVDLGEESQVRHWIADVGARCRQIHVLINNAASDPRMTLEKTSTREWDRLFARNLRACFLTCREASPWMRSGASIINLSSITVHTGPAFMSAYVATKAGILGFTRSLARELGPRGIRVNTISPGWVMTERQLRQYITPSIKRRVKQMQCIPELIQPAEIASVAVFLATDASRAVTGQEILVDRGWAHS